MMKLNVKKYSLGEIENLTQLMSLKDLKKELMRIRKVDSKNVPSTLRFVIDSETESEEAGEYTVSCKGGSKPADDTPNMEAFRIAYDDLVSNFHDTKLGNKKGFTDQLGHFREPQLALKVPTKKKEK